MRHRPADGDAGDESGNPYRVQAAERALALLRCFERGPRQRTLAELADATGVPRPSAFRLLSTLEEHGFVRRIGTTYGLGHRSLVLAHVYQADLAVEAAALPVLERLRDETNETTQLAVFEDWQVICLAGMLSHHPVAYMRSRVGAVLPAHCTALGKALLAAREPDEVAAWVGRQTLAARTPRTLTDPEQLLAELGLTRRRGHAIDDEEWETGVRCVAAPVCDGSGRTIAAVSVAGPAERLPRDLSSVAAQVVGCAADLSERLGYVPPEPAVEPALERAAAP